MDYIKTQKQSGSRLIAGFLAALLFVICLFPTVAHADWWEYDSTASNSLQISFMQVKPTVLNQQFGLNKSLYYKSPYLSGVYAHVMDVVGDDGQVGVGFCGDHSKALGAAQVRSDVWNFAGVWTPNGSAPFLDYYYLRNFESDLVRAENPGQTEAWYSQALNTEEWSYAKYTTASQRYYMNTAVQLAVWLDRTGTLSDLPSIETYSCGWNTVKTTNWYKVLLKELTTYYKVIGNKNASAVADNMIRCVLDNYYAQDYTSDIQVFEYLHSTKPDYYQPLLVIWYK